jgi:xylulokinase
VRVRFSKGTPTDYWASITGSYLPDALEHILGHVPALPKVLEPRASKLKTPAGALIGAGAGEHSYRVRERFWGVRPRFGRH